jgi:hypothetical protein
MFRRVATRYDKTAESFLSFVQLAAIHRWMRFFHTAWFSILNAPVDLRSIYRSKSSTLAAFCSKSSQIYRSDCFKNASAHEKSHIINNAVVPFFSSRLSQMRQLSTLQVYNLVLIRMMPKISTRMPLSTPHRSISGAAFLRNSRRYQACNTLSRTSKPLPSRT